MQGLNKAKTIDAKGFSRKLKRMRQDWMLYLMFLPVLLWIYYFCARPLGGIVLAWKDFSYKGGIWGSKWVGWQWFVEFFSEPDAVAILWNTIYLGVLYLAAHMVVSVGFALLINEIRIKRGQKFVQTAVTLPHFISWVIMAGMFSMIVSSTGPINAVLTALGRPLFTPQTKPGLFRAYLIVTSLIKEAGWGSILYLAAIIAVDQSQYESADIDGASRLQQMVHITLPGIKGIIIVQLILGVGSVVTNGHFDQIFNMYSIPVYRVADTLDTYIFRETLQTGGLDFGFSTAVGLIKQVIGLAMLLTTNRIAKAAGERGIM